MSHLLVLQRTPPRFPSVTHSCPPPASTTGVTHICLPPSAAPTHIRHMQCHLCERSIEPGELIVRHRYQTKPRRGETPGDRRWIQRGYGSSIGVMCKGCHIKREKGRRYKESEDPFHGLAERQCAYCGRVIWNYWGLGGAHPGCDICSEQCRNKLRTIKRRVRPRTVACESCGESFHPKRRDAKTCGPTCRQQLHRAHAPAYSDGRCRDVETA